ncbi:thioester domain-containing protein [Micromonospora cathayae]|uniref:Thioester domain-containing protein n=1 Tax=Micromonospora cathayae TaxID=3028804 RepID=A0ABY7ZQF5_9ACTN|nr:thioester domain-containing protein [Micromonospora sp. HUAS 3]WDZ85251.1 thioester domain-containing protein [Micromonospora sp. HUAS 3]
MFGPRGRRWARLTAATIAGSALALVTAAPALAEDPATGVAKSVKDSSVTLKLNGEKKSTSALALKIGRETVPAFCIDYHTAVAIDGKYQEDTWSDAQVKNLGKVQWVLTHGYPNADPAQLLDAADATLPRGVNAKKRDNLLYFGTQTAVWHFSDGVTLDPWARGMGLTDKNEYEVVKKVHDWLVANATDKPEPKAELTVSPASAEAKVGEKAGPFTVAGPAGEITLAVQGGSAVDAEGNPVTSTTNEGKFWLTRDGAGEVTVTLTGKGGQVSFGRVFLFTGERAAQKLILGGSTGSDVTAKAGAAFAAAPVEETPTPTPTTPAETPTPTPTVPAGTPTPSAPVTISPSPASGTGGGDLPLTGSPVATAVGAGLLLLVAGAVAVVIVRRRKVRFTA